MADVSAGEKSLAIDVHLLWPLDISDNSNVAVPALAYDIFEPIHAPKIRPANHRELIEHQERIFERGLALEIKARCLSDRGLKVHTWARGQDRARSADK